MSRASLHALAGLLSLAYAVLPPPWAVGLAAFLVVHNVWLLPRYVPQWMRPAGPNADSGVLTYPLVVLGATACFLARLDLAAAAWALLAFGDAAASAVGRRFGRHRLPWNAAKSLEGLIAFVAAGGACAGLVQSFVAHEGARLAPPTSPTIWGAALAAGLAETLASRLDDNVRIGLAAVVVLGFPVAGGPDPRVLYVLAANLLLGAIAWRAGAISRGGFVAGVLLGTILGALGGSRLFAVLAAFVVVALGATVLRRARSATRAPREWEARGARHALANLGVATALGAASSTTAHPEALRVAAVGALATAAADTTATEMGQAFARQAVRLVPWGRVAAGTAGAVSWPGTVSGVAAGALVAAVAAALHVVEPRHVAAIAAGAMLASLAESFAASSTRVRAYVGPHARNVLNTLAGAALAVILAGRRL